MEIKTEEQYKEACARVNRLLQVVNANPRATDADKKELDTLSDAVAEYEEENYPVAPPTLAEILKERMYELGLSRSKMASLLHVSPSSISSYLSGRREPTLKVGREIHDKLGVDSNVILGVS